MVIDAGEQSAAGVKQCCALFYGSDAARALFGESFHPGGVALTLELGEMLGLTADSVVLDVASGRGVSAFGLAERFGCRVTGVDLSEGNVTEANAESKRRGLEARVDFQVADAERLPFTSESFDIIVCECAFCTFPDKAAAASEFARVLKPKGRVGLSDLTRVAEPLPELDGLLAWIACIGDAQPLENYAAWLTDAGFSISSSASRHACLHDLVASIRGKLFTAEILIGLKKLELPGLDIEQAKRFAKVAAQAVHDRKLGYAVLVGERRSA
ncbi:MAG: class I SAM-dependent methyltransferase [Candidatus Eremiobacteraeota bacterium]|nr:class I SAM-dependent methyltransferase [Candidatus Eremiobacteraeota bacterium]